MSSGIMTVSEPEVKYTLQQSKDEFETVATHFGLYKGKFTDHVNELSTGELRRLIKALVEYPLTDKIYIDNNASNNLKNAFNIGDSLLQSKMIMLMLSMQDEEFKKSEEVKQAASSENNMPETKEKNETN